MSHPTTQDAATLADPSRLRRTVIAAGVGSVIEYYDFSIYAFLATTMAVVFFPADDPVAGLLATLLIFGAAFVTRPVGGIIVGHITDRYGRRAGLSLAVIAMAVATAGIGLVPGYATIGIAAPILLALLRCVQGLAAGGELGGAAAYVSEAAPAHRRGLFASTTQLGVIVGTALGSLTVTVLRLLLTQEQMIAWGWRLPFLVSVVLSVAAAVYRRRMEESADFEELKDRRSVTRMPVLEMFRRSPMAIVNTAAISLMSFATYYLVFTYMSTYFSMLEIVDSRVTGWAVLASLILAGVAIPIWGRISDRIGRKPVLLGVCIANVVLTVPLFLLMPISPAFAVLSLIILGQIEGACLGVLAATFVEMFPAKVRASGFSLGFNIAAIVGGGLAPYVVTWLMDQTGDPLSPAYFLMAASVISLLFTIRITETAGRPLPLDWDDDRTTTTEDDHG